MVLDPRIVTLSAFYGSAQLLTCGLIRTNRSKGAPDWGVNALSVLQFLPTPCTGTPKLVHITKRLENSPGGNHRLFVSRSELLVSEALALCWFKEAFTDPRTDGKTPPLESRGVWIGPEFVGREEHRARSCIPCSESTWLLECWRANDDLEEELGYSGTEWLCRRIHELTGINLNGRRERLGNFLIAMPELQHRMRVWWSQTGNIGVEIRTVPRGPSQFALIVRVSRDDCLAIAEHRIVGEGHHVFTLPHTVEHRAVELYDANTGTIVGRDAGTQMRAVQFTGHIATTSVDLTFTFQDGGPPIRVQTWWGTTMHSQAGGHEPWELKLAEARARQRREELRESNRLYVYRGNAGERTKAVSDIRAILNSCVVDYVKIWDPYFGARDAAEFLPFVFDSSTKVDVLTSAEPAPNEALPKVLSTDAGLGEAPPSGEARPASLRELKKVQLKKVLDALRRPQPDATGLLKLDCRVGAGMFHDRFIITRDRCWQLGCSFNQIGGVMSTIVEFPYPQLIELEFDRAWSQAKEQL